MKSLDRPVVWRAFSAACIVALLVAGRLLCYPHSTEPGFRPGLYAGMIIWLINVLTLGLARSFPRRRR